MQPTAASAPAGIVAIYVIYWFFLAWFSAFARHLRETVDLVKRKLDPTLPSGVHVTLRQPWFVRYGLLENALAIGGIGYGLGLLRWPWILGGFAIFLFIFIPVCVRWLTPGPGAWQYLRQIRRLLQIGAADAEQKGNREKAEIYRIALERIDKGF